MSEAEIENRLLAAIAADELDFETRLVYADLLEEQGRDGEAEEQRRRAESKWREAVAGLREMADRFCTEEYAVTQELGPHRVETPMTLEDLLAAGRRWIDDGEENPHHVQWFPAVESPEISEHFGWQHPGNENLDRFWKWWHDYYGLPRKGGEEDPFICSC